MSDRFDAAGQEIAQRLMLCSTTSAMGRRIADALRAEHGRAFNVVGTTETFGLEERALLGRVLLRLTRDAEV